MTDRVRRIHSPIPPPSNRGGLSGEAQFAYGGDERGIGQEPGRLSEKLREQRRFGGREVRDEDDGDSGTRGGDDDGLLVHGLGVPDPNGGVKVVGVGTDRRLSLAQNPVVRGNVARPRATVRGRYFLAGAVFLVEPKSCFHAGDFVARRGAIALQRVPKAPA